MCGAQTSLRADLCAAATKWFAGYSVFERILKAISALDISADGGRTVEWFVDSRDSLGEVSSTSIPPRHVVVQAWSITVADDEAWQLTVPELPSEAQLRVVIVQRTSDAMKAHTQKVERQLDEMDAAARKLLDGPDVSPITRQLMRSDIRDQVLAQLPYGGRLATVRAAIAEAAADIVINSGDARRCCTSRDRCCPTQRTTGKRDVQRGVSTADQGGCGKWRARAY